MTALFCYVWLCHVFISWNSTINRTHEHFTKKLREELCSQWISQTFIFRFQHRVRSEFTWNHFDLNYVNNSVYFFHQFQFNFPQKFHSSTNYLQFFLRSGCIEIIAFVLYVFERIRGNWKKIFNLNKYESLADHLSISFDLHFCIFGAMHARNLIKMAIANKRKISGKSTHFNLNKRCKPVGSAMLLSLSTGNEFSYVCVIFFCLVFHFIWAIFFLPPICDTILV